MAFSLRVWCSQLDECFSVPVAQAAIEAAELKALIQGDPSGKDIRFTTASWNIFLASSTGVKEGAPLPFNHPFAPAGGSIVNVWVEPKPGAAAVPAAAGAGGAVAGGAGGAGVGGALAVAARSVTAFAGHAFQAEATVALQHILKNACPWLAQPSVLQYRDLDNHGTSRDADIFAYVKETSQGQCHSVPSKGLRVVGRAPQLRAALPLAVPAGRAFSPYDASRTGPQKYFLAEAYSGDNDETQEDKLQQLETLMEFTQRRYEDRTDRVVADITSLIGVAGLVLSAGEEKRDVALEKACNRVREHAGPRARRLMQAGRFFVLVLEKAQMPNTVFQREMGATAIATAAAVEAMGFKLDTVLSAAFAGGSAGGAAAAAPPPAAAAAAAAATSAGGGHRGGHRGGRGGGAMKRK